MTQTAATSDCPLYVDLDGTLIHTDLLWESLLLMAGHHPLASLQLPIWLASGRARLKDELSRRVMPDVRSLPYRQDVIDFLTEQKQAGRRIVLATASHQRVAQAVADHLGLFGHVLATSGTVNLRGENKLRAIQDQAGAGGFDYVGDSAADLPIWKSARRSYLIGGNERVQRQAALSARHIMSLTLLPAGGAVIQALRPSQWVKNVLLFVPIFFSHQYHDLHRLMSVVFAFIAISLCASAVYVLNDLFDLEKDRLHARKRRRPFASGLVSVPAGVAMFCCLLCAAFAVAIAWVNWPFAVLLAVYAVSSTAYSLVFKSRLIVDVILLAGLYTVRIVAGGAAAALEVWASPWLLAYSLFFFMSLAFVKRYSELRSLKQSGAAEWAAGRAYGTGDLDMLANIGLNSGYMSVMVFCLYINSDTVRQLYRQPVVLWFICPILLYWITRLWVFARRGRLHDDPVLFAVTDRVSLISALCSVLLVLAASSGWIGKWIH